MDQSAAPAGPAETDPSSGTEAGRGGLWARQRAPWPPWWQEETALRRVVADALRTELARVPGLLVQGLLPFLPWHKRQYPRLPVRLARQVLMLLAVLLREVRKAAKPNLRGTLSL